MSLFDIGPGCSSSILLRRLIQQHNARSTQRKRIHSGIVIAKITPRFDDFSVAAGVVTALSVLVVVDDAVWVVSEADILLEVDDLTTAATTKRLNVLVDLVPEFLPVATKETRSSPSAASVGILPDKMKSFASKAIHASAGEISASIST
jgi:hypothetical protein